MPIPSFRHLSDDTILLPRAVEELAGQVLGAARQVYRGLGAGLTEPIYQEAIEIALAEAGIEFVAQPRIRPVFRGRVLRHSAVPDLLVGSSIVVELKAVESFHPMHEAQLLTYLRLTQRPLGFLINFNAPTLSAGIKRRVLT